MVSKAAQRINSILAPFAIRLNIFLPLKQLFESLYHGLQLDSPAARALMLRIGRGELSEAAIAALTAVYRMRPITAAELNGFREALLELCVPVKLDRTDTLDIVGTGGDGKNTFNISTTSAFVVAGAGIPITKHGSYGVSSNSGSSDVLLQLGSTFATDSAGLQRQLDRAGICFLHAPLFHPALKHAVPVRKALRVKTFFNMLGPLVNPLQPDYQLFGTYDLRLAALYQDLLTQAKKRFTVAYALDGYDEVSLTGPFQLRTATGTTLHLPEDLGLSHYTPTDLYGGENAEDAARILLAVLENKATPAQRDVVLANAAVAIRTVRPEASLLDCVAAARESLASGAARETLTRLIA